MGYLPHHPFSPYVVGLESPTYFVGSCHPFPVTRYPLVPFLYAGAVYCTLLYFFCSLFPVYCSPILAISSKTSSSSRVGSPPYSTQYLYPALTIFFIYKEVKKRFTSPKSLTSLIFNNLLSPHKTVIDLSL